MHCRNCKKKLFNKVINIGKQCISSVFPEKIKNNFKKYSLDLYKCDYCELVQFKKTPPFQDMYGLTYGYRTSLSPLMIDHIKDKYKYINKKKYLKNGSSILDIGSNDGTFLNNFNKKKIKIIGFEPSSNVANISKKKGIKTVNSFFNYKNVKNLKSLHKKINIITAANVICHIPDLKNLIKGIEFLLNDKGFFIFEEPYLGSMYDKVSYDQIYDEHIYIFSVHSIKKIFERYNFELIDVIPQNTHGGSMRYVVSRKGQNKVKFSVEKLLKKEKIKNIDNLKGCLKFKKRCEKSKKDLIKKINRLKKDKKIIAGYGATSKSTTILNYCGIDYKKIKFICDTTPEKIGKFSPGTHIPIVPMKHFYSNLPDAIFLFAWNHKKEIFEKEKKLIKKKNWFAHIRL